MKSIAFTTADPQAYFREKVKWANWGRPIIQLAPAYAKLFSDVPEIAQVIIRSTDGDVRVVWREVVKREISFYGKEFVFMGFYDCVRIWLRPHTVKPTMP